MRRLLALIALPVFAAACPPAAVEVYHFRPADAAVAPALATGTPVLLLDISLDPETTYDDARARVGAERVVGSFRAIHRAGSDFSPLRGAIEGYARERGADVAIVTCAPRVVDAASALVCSGVLARRGSAPGGAAPAP